jgi:hypothetical protein
VFETSKLPTQVKFRGITLANRRLIGSQSVFYRVLLDIIR